MNADIQFVLKHYGQYLSLDKDGHVEFNSSIEYGDSFHTQEELLEYFNDFNELYNYNPLEIVTIVWFGS